MGSQSARFLNLNPNHNKTVLLPKLSPPAPPTTTFSTATSQRYPSSRSQLQVIVILRHRDSFRRILSEQS
jgi:hypothetical protein